MARVALFAFRVQFYIFPVSVRVELVDAFIVAVGSRQACGVRFGDTRFCRFPERV